MNKKRKKFKLDTDKIYRLIGKILVYGIIYIGTVIFGYFMFLAGMTY